MIVVDTNVLVQFVLDPNFVASRVMLRDARRIAPRLWRSEFRSSLAAMLRIQGLPADHAVDAFHRAETLVSLERELETADVLSLIERTKCTAYDPEFVALALALNVRW